MTTKGWTSSEIATLRKEAHLGAKGLALILDRSVASIKAAANRYRISLRPPSEQRGLILGQPRGTAWLEQVKFGITKERLEMIRQEALAGELDITALEERVRNQGSDRKRPTCPACSARPQDHASTGLCGVCHMRALAQAHRENHIVDDAKRELWRAKQEASRARRATLRAEYAVNIEDEDFDGDR